MRVGLDVPQAVVERRVFVAGDLLLLEAPVGQLDLVREEVAAGEKVTEADVRAQREDVLPRPARLRLRELNDKDVVSGGSAREKSVRQLPGTQDEKEGTARVALKAVKAVARDLVLEVDLADRRPDVVRVDTLL